MVAKKTNKKPETTIEINEVGRPAFKVTESQKKLVIEMASNGIPQEQIAAVIGCSVDTLHKYFNNDFLKGKAMANNKLAGVLYNKAIQGDTAALIFWLKTQAKFKETDKLELTGKDDGPVEISDAKAKLLAGLKKD